MIRFVRFADRRPAILAILLGAAAACGFAPLQLWPLTLACLGGWLWLVHRAPTLRAALWRGWAFGLGHFTINDNWFQHAFDFQDAMPPVLGYVAPLALAIYLAVYPAMAAGLAWRWRRAEAPDYAYVLAFGAAWIVTEWLRATLFTGYAWDPLGVIWVPFGEIARLAADIGTYALSGLTIVTAGVLLMAVHGTWWPLAGKLALIAIQIVRGALAPDPPAPPADGPRIVVVQPNVPQDQRGESDGEMMLRRLSALSGRPGAQPRLLLWPEGVIRDYIEDGYPPFVYGPTDPRLLRLRMAALLGPRDRLLTGGTALQFDMARETVTATNSVFAIDPAGRIAGRYDKAHLVPYGEYLPMPWLLRPLGLARLVPGEMDFAPGPGPRALTLPGFPPVGMQVCYEIIFSGRTVDPAHRPAILFNPSNDAWFGRWGSPQFLAQARMRAIEEGLPVVRATPTGISAVIAADGRVIATVPHLRAGRIEVPMPAPLPPTIFARMGNAMAGIVAALLALAAIALRRRAR